jgi:hypothetical protein
MRHAPAVWQCDPCQPHSRAAKKEGHTMYLRFLPANSTHSASAFTVFRGTRKLATIDGTKLTEHHALTPEERDAVLVIAEDPETL